MKNKIYNYFQLKNKTVTNPNLETEKNKWNLEEKKIKE